MSEKKELSTLEQLQKELLKGGDTLDALNHQLTENLYDSLSAHNVMTDHDTLYDLIEKSVKTTISVWAGGNTEPIVSHDAQKLAEEQKEQSPDLDTRKDWNNPDLNLALAGSKNSEEQERFNKANAPVDEEDKSAKQKKSAKKSD